MKFGSDWKFKTEISFVEYHELSLKLWTKVAQLLVFFSAWIVNKIKTIFDYFSKSF
jgi:hypothetical protein